MGTGGIIPTSKTQTVTFYNTTGLIERGKNVYFAPRLSKSNARIGQTLSLAYLNEFKRVCPPFSDYSDMDISGWSPEDRTLVINGNIDDFRLITEVGNCLNYLIITRQVVTNNTTKTYYYAFFITGVNQVGKNSVRVTIEPDDFTNVFYLHNEKVLTYNNIHRDYEPFNGKMKNCYVNRQHYNRVTIVENTKYQLNVNLMLEGSTPSTGFHVGDEITLHFGNDETLELSGEVLSAVYSPILDRWDLEVGYFTNNPTIPTATLPVHGTINGDSFTYTYLMTSWTTIPAIINADNMNIFLNQEESFKFKYQYRDFRKDFPFNYEGVEISSLTDLYNNSYSELSLSQKITLLSNCLSFYVIETKSLDSFYKIMFYGRRQGQVSVPTLQTLITSTEFIKENVRRTSPLAVFPFIDIPEDFKKNDFSPEIIYRFNFDNRTLDFSYSDLLNTHGDSFNDLTELFLSLLHKNNMDEEMSALYITKNIPYSKFCEFDVVNQKVIFNFNYSSSFLPDDYPVESLPTEKIIPEYNELYLAGLLATKEQEDPELRYIEFSEQSNGTNKFNFVPRTGLNLIQGIPVILFSGKLSLNSYIIFDKKVYANLKDNYYDPVLEAEPYNFYSISYQANELVFNKNRYYFDFRVEFEFTSAFNGMQSESFIPYYNVEGKISKYLNESLSFVLSEYAPLVSDAYLTYYYQNMAQMKNQFAVNNYNRHTDISQQTLISGPASIAKGFVKSKEAGIGTAIGELAELANSFVDWSQSDKVIDMNQKAKLADMGRVPDTLSQAGTELYSSLIKNEYSFKLNHYTIDGTSYISIAKYLERFGYNVSLYSTLNTMNRVGYNFVQLTSFDWVIDTTNKVMVSQQESIKSIFQEGVTLVHDKSYLTSGHNYETILE